MSLLTLYQQLLAQGKAAAGKEQLTDVIAALNQPLSAVAKTYQYALAPENDADSITIGAGTTALLDVVQQDELSHYPHFSTTTDRRLVVGQFTGQLALGAAPAIWPFLSSSASKSSWRVPAQNSKGWGFRQAAGSTGAKPCRPPNPGNGFGPPARRYPFGGH
ncbi:hypothetical protein [Gallaecimonas mangrovi]|uniref:hypothetical protein n=1 Tax=Gallaecimonas mangrovi TaxID=2291597 RepID=UPI000E201E65|nr:hypothetical protein [Gallaecimonas mangrovi]